MDNTNIKIKKETFQLSLYIFKKFKHNFFCKLAFKQTLNCLFVPFSLVFNCI